MIKYTNENLRLLGELRRQKAELNALRQEIRAARGVRKPKPVYERAVEGLFAALIEKPIRRVVDTIFDRLDRWRERRKSVGF